MGRGRRSEGGDGGREGAFAGKKVGHKVVKEVFGEGGIRVEGEAGTTNLGGEAVRRCRRYDRGCKGFIIIVVTGLRFGSEGREVVVDGFASEVLDVCECEAEIEN